MTLGTLLLVILVVLLVAALPRWSYSSAWVPFPAGIIGTVLIVILVLVGQI